MRIMRDKADLYDRLEATEHQLLLMQGQTDTIGEWIDADTDIDVFSSQVYCCCCSVFVPTV